MRVDVVMPVRNGARFLAAAVEGLQRQTEADWRLLALDHASTDESLALLSRIASSDKRIEVIDGAKYASLTAVRNAALGFTEASVVLVQDADDVSSPDRIGASLRAFDRYPDVIAVAGQANLIDSEGSRIGRMQRPQDIDRVRAASLFFNPIIHPSVAFDRARLIAAGAAYGVDFLGTGIAVEPDLVATLVEDYFLTCQLGLTGRIVNIPDVLIDYRLHGSNISNLRRDEQIRRSLFVSRFSCRYLSSVTSTTYFDPAPFCNHCSQLYAVSKTFPMRDAIHAIAQSCRTAFGDGLGTNRELAYRYSIATRSSARMLLNHGVFRLSHRAEADEANAVREWFIGPLIGRPRIAAPADFSLHRDDQRIASG